MSQTHYDPKKDIIAASDVSNITQRKQRPSKSDCECVEKLIASW